MTAPSLIPGEVALAAFAEQVKNDPTAVERMETARVARAASALNTGMSESDALQKYGAETLRRAHELNKQFQEKQCG